MTDPSYEPPSSGRIPGRRMPLPVGQRGASTLRPAPRPLPTALRSALTTDDPYAALVRSVVEAFRAQQQIAARAPQRDTSPLGLIDNAVDGIGRLVASVPRLPGLLPRLPGALANIGSAFLVHREIGQAYPTSPQADPFAQLPPLLRARLGLVGGPIPRGSLALPITV